MLANMASWCVMLLACIFTVPLRGGGDPLVGSVRRPDSPPPEVGGVETRRWGGVEHLRPLGHSWEWDCGKDHALGI